MSADSVIALSKASAVRRVATKAGALKFNKAIGQIIGQDASKDSSISRSATLTRLLSLYNQMRAAKLYGQDAKFERAKMEMADAIASYSKKSPNGAKRIRDVVDKLTFAEEEKARAKAAEKRA